MLILPIGLICKLWEQSFKGDHLKSGFKKAGLFPIPSQIDDIISTTAMAPSIPFRCREDSSTEDNNIDICFDVCCRKCGGAITPVKLHLAVYFAKELQYKPTGTNKKDKRKAECDYYGEVLTSDEVADRIESKEKERNEREKEKMKKKEEQERLRVLREEEKRIRKEEVLKRKEERKRKQEEQAKLREEKKRLREEKKQKKTNKQKAITGKAACKSSAYNELTQILFLIDPLIDENTCSVCGNIYEEGDEIHWIGCDSCCRWFHYTCAGFNEMPPLNIPFHCGYCN